MDRPPCCIAWAQGSRGHRHRHVTPQHYRMHRMRPGPDSGWGAQPFPAFEESFDHACESAEAQFEK